MVQDRQKWKATLHKIETCVIVGLICIAIGMTVALWWAAFAMSFAS